MRTLWSFVHLLGVSGLLLFHGVQIWALFSLAPAFPDRERIFDRAEQSRMATMPMYVSLAILVVGGVAAGIERSWFSRGWWLWTSIVVLLATIGAMAGMATPFMRKVREATTRWADGSYPMNDADLEALLRGPMTRVIAGTGSTGLLLILWLMVAKPGA